MLSLREWKEFCEESQIPDPIDLDESMDSKFQKQYLKRKRQELEEAKKPKKTKIK